LRVKRYKQELTDTKFIYNTIENCTEGKITVQTRYDYIIYNAKTR